MFDFCTHLPSPNKTAAHGRDYSLLPVSPAYSERSKPWIEKALNKCLIKLNTVHKRHLKIMHHTTIKLHYSNSPSLTFPQGLFPSSVIG